MPAHPTRRRARATWALALVLGACATTEATRPLTTAPPAAASVEEPAALAAAPTTAATAVTTESTTASSLPASPIDDASPASLDDGSVPHAEQAAALDEEAPAGETGDEAIDDDAVVLEGAPETLELAASATVEHHDLAAADFDIPVVDNPRVDRWMSYFTGRGAPRFRTWLQRMGRYAPLMRPMLRERGLPEDTIYLAMIESGLSARAYSRARASGYWQFIARTGQAYGLSDDFWVDQRRDPVRATEAAARHLKDLHAEFGDWYLAWAAYNAGPGKIREAIRRYETRDFFELCEHPYLRSETREYVPKLIAAARIAKHPERYGFDGIAPLEPFAHDSIDVGDATDLGLVADGCGVDMEVLSELNPELKRWATPPRDKGQPGYQVRVPPGLRERCQAALDGVPAEQRLTFRHHRVRQGEVPSKIAARYGISLATMMRMNKIRDARRLRAGQDLLIPIPARVPERLFRAQRVAQRPGDDGEIRKPRAASDRPTSPRPAARATAKPAPAPAAVPPGTRPLTHVIASGDSLWSLSQRYQVTINDLRQWNRLKKRAVLQPGQALVVHVPRG